MDNQKVAAAISYLRKRAGYTQKELADRLGISDKAVSKWERGLGFPDIAYLRKLSILLDTDSDSLLAGDVIHHDSGWRGVLLLDKAPSGVGLHTVIYDKPLVYFLLGYFLLVGIKEILIVCSPEEAAFVRTELGNGSTLGIHLLYGDDGLSSALEQYPHFAERGSFMIVHGRSFLFGVDQTRFFQKAMIHRDRLTILSLPNGRKSPHEKLCFDEDKKIICEWDTDDINTQYDYYEIPILFCPHTLFHSVCSSISTGSVADDSMLKDRYLYTEMLDRGFVEISVDTWDDVLKASSFVQIVQETCGMNLYCLEEIAWRRGMIGTDQLEMLANRQTDPQLKKYLFRLYGRI